MKTQNRIGGVLVSILTEQLFAAKGWRVTATTIVWDHVRGRVVWIGEGRERDTLDAFFAKLGRRRSRRLRVVTMDMWQGYIGSVKAHAPLPTSCSTASTSSIT